MDKETKTTDKNASKAQGEPHRVRLPGFITETEVGLGDVIKRATSTIGIAPCDDCNRRAAALNRWMAFTGRHPKS